MGLIYVGNAIDDTISVLCSDKNTELEKIKLSGSGLSPRRMLYYDGMLFVANANASSVTALNVKNRKQNTISVGTYPIGISRVKNKIFICCGESNSIWRIDCRKEKSELCCHAGVFPISITSNDKSIYVSCLISGDIIQLAPSLITKNKAALKALAMCTLEVPDGLLTCCLAGEGRGELISQNTSLMIKKRVNLASPIEYMIKHPHLNAIVAAHLWDNSISFIDLDSYNVIKTVKTSRMPDQIVICQDKIYVSCIMSNCVDVFSIDGKPICKIKVGREPRGMAVRDD